MSFVGSKFLVSHHRFRAPKHFHRRLPLELCLTTNTESFTRGGIYPYLLLPNTSFFLPLYSTVQLCWTSSNGTEPTQSITKRSVDYNHALTPIQCNVLVHIKCNAPLHFISRHMYNECYLDNIIHTNHWVSWTITSHAYDFHATFHSCQYIMHAYIKNTHIDIQTCPPLVKQ